MQRYRIDFVGVDFGQRTLNGVVRMNDLNALINEADAIQLFCDMHGIAVTVHVVDRITGNRVLPTNHDMPDDPDCLGDGRECCACDSLVG